MKKKIAIITATRAEYGLLYPLIKQLNKETSFVTHLIVTGTHLSRLHGYTIEKIQQDNMRIDETIDLTMDQDTATAVSHYISKGITEFSNAYEKLQPDAVMVLGDRYELWAACIPAVVMQIPIIHIHGGELTKGAIDDTIRHTITKMAAIHFPSIEPYAKRIIQMGESPENVFVVGSLGIDNIRNTRLLSKLQVAQVTDLNFNKPTAMMTFHPVTTECYQTAEDQVKTLLEAILKTELVTLITMPNADVGGLVVYKTIMSYKDKYPEKFKFIASLGMLNYLSCLQYVDLMIGNSSSGILESASFKLPVVNVGDRQEGRMKPRNIIDCKCDQNAIQYAINEALSESFKMQLKDLKNPYGQGDTANKIVSTLKELNLKEKDRLIKKGFNDIAF